MAIFQVNLEGDILVLPTPKNSGLWACFENKRNENRFSILADATKI